MWTFNGRIWREGKVLGLLLPREESRLACIFCISIETEEWGLVRPPWGSTCPHFEDRCRKATTAFRHMTSNLWCSSERLWRKEGACSPTRTHLLYLCNRWGPCMHSQVSPSWPSDGPSGQNLFCPFGFAHMFWHVQKRHGAFLYLSIVTETNGV